MTIAEHRKEPFIEGFQNKDSTSIFILLHDRHASLLELATNIAMDAAAGEYLLIKAYQQLIQLRRNFNSMQDIDSFLHSALQSSCNDFAKYPRDLYAEMVEVSLPAFVMPTAIFEEVDKWDIRIAAIADLIIFQGLNAFGNRSYWQLLDMPEKALRQKLIELRLFRTMLMDQYDN